MTNSTAQAVQPQAASPARVLYRTAQVRACDVIRGDVVLDGRVWREVLDVAHTPEDAARAWSWTPMAGHVDDAWQATARIDLPEVPTFLSEQCWNHPHGIAGIAMTAFDGAQEYVAIRVLALSSGEIDSLVMLAPVSSLVTIQVPEGAGLGQ